jgi:hypothetical protein
LRYHVNKKHISKKNLFDEPDDPVYTHARVKVEYLLGG